MLALTRKVGESITIGENIEVVILSVSGDQVKLGISAPKDITIYRKELYEQIKSENSIALKNNNINSIKKIFG